MSIEKIQIQTNRRGLVLSTILKKFFEKYSVTFSWYQIVSLLVFNNTQWKWCSFICSYLSMCMCVCWSFFRISSWITCICNDYFLTQFISFLSFRKCWSRRRLKEKATIRIPPSKRKSKLEVTKNLQTASLRRIFKRKFQMEKRYFLNFVSRTATFGQYALDFY